MKGLSETLLGSGNATTTGSSSSSRLPMKEIVVPASGSSSCSLMSVSSIEFSVGTTLEDEKRQDRQERRRRERRRSHHQKHHHGGARAHATASASASASARSSKNGYAQAAFARLPADQNMARWQTDTTTASTLLLEDSLHSSTTSRSMCIAMSGSSSNVSPPSRKRSTENLFIDSWGADSSNTRDHSLPIPSRKQSHPSLVMSPDRCSTDTCATTTNAANNYNYNADLGVAMPRRKKSNPFLRDYNQYHRDNYSNGTRDVAASSLELRLPRRQQSKPSGLVYTIDEDKSTVHSHYDEEGDDQHHHNNGNFSHNHNHNHNHNWTAPTLTGSSNSNHLSSSYPPRFQDSSRQRSSFVRVAHRTIAPLSDRLFPTSRMVPSDIQHMLSNNHNHNNNNSGVSIQIMPPPMPKRKPSLMDFQPETTTTITTDPLQQTLKNFDFSSSSSSSGCPPPTEHRRGISLDFFHKVPTALPNGTNSVRAKFPYNTNTSGNSSTCGGEAPAAASLRPPSIPKRKESLMDFQTMS